MVAGCKTVICLAVVDNGITHQTVKIKANDEAMM